MNRTQLIGRLGRDPEGRYGATGCYAYFSVATKEYRAGRSTGQVVEHTECHQLVCYDRLAEIALEFLTKGSEVYVEGRHRTMHRTGKNGKEQRSIELRVDELRMLRHAPKADSVPVAVKAMAGVETLLKDIDIGLRTDVSLAHLASMLHCIRTDLLAKDARMPAAAAAGNAQPSRDADSNSVETHPSRAARPLADAALKTPRA